jgi:hypothetical protein
VTSWLEPAAGGETLVKMEADITLTGAAAQLSRGLLPEVSRKLTQQFADCLHDSMQAEDVAPAPAEPAAAPSGAGAGDAPAGGEPASAASPPPAAAASPTSPAPAPRVAAKPVGGIRLGLSAIWSLIVGFFRRLFGGGRRG